MGSIVQLDYEEVRHANAVAAALISHKDSGDALVTHEMVRMAPSRAVAVETAYAAVEFYPHDIFHALQEINHGLRNIDNHVKIGLAQTANLRMISRNTRLQAPLQLLPLQKTVIGYGRNLALPFLHILNAAGRQLFHAQFPANGNAAEVGEIPPDFNSRIEAYRHFDIFRMMAFYNQNFEIIAQDDLPERVNKFRRFLAEY